MSRPPSSSEAVGPQKAARSLPDWPPKDWQALAALLFSVLGAVALTALLWWGIAQLLPAKGWHEATEANRATAIRWALWIVAGGIVLVLTGLGFAVNKRRLNAKWGDKSLDWEGGEDDAPAAAQATAAAAQDKADEIAAAASEGPADGQA